MSRRTATALPTLGQVGICQGGLGKGVAAFVVVRRVPGAGGKYGTGRAPARPDARDAYLL